MVFMGKTFGRCLCFEGGALMKGVSALESSPFSPERTWGDICMRLRKESSDHAGTLVLDFQTQNGEK